MNFNEKLNFYLNELNCSSKDLSNKSHISQAVISRYRNGERTPRIESIQLEKIANAIFEISIDKGVNYTKEEIMNELKNSINVNEQFDYESFSNNLNTLITLLNINVREMSKHIVFDASHISRIRYGKSRPSEPIEFSKKICNYIVLKYNEPEKREALLNIIGANSNISTNTDLFNFLFKWLTSANNSNKKNYMSDFLNNLDKFDLNDYIKAIKFDKLKVPNIPFYIIKSKRYYGIEEMKNGELDFFKATVLSKSKEDIFMCSDMPMEDMAKDIEFGKKWMFAIAMCLKKGLHLNIIHNLDRPFNEMMLGLESWLPIYMTGQVSPFYLKEVKNSIYHHFNYVSGVAALTGECIKNHHSNGMYYLFSNSKEITYYKEKAQFMLKNASPLMEIYRENDSIKFSFALQKNNSIDANRKRFLNSLPLFTIDNELLIKILKRNKISKEDIKKILNYKNENEKCINKILETNIITDNIYIPTKDEFNLEPLSLSLEDIFYNKKINYNYDEYILHLKSTKNYQLNNNHYKLIISSNKTFKNISISIIENNSVIISKSGDPIIHFIIKHPKLINAISNFTPLVNEK